MDDMSMMADMSSSGGYSMPMMKMYFHFGLGDQLLFSNLIIDTQVKLCLACLILFALAILLEAIKFLRGLRCHCQLRPFHKKLSGQAHLHELTQEGSHNDCDDPRNRSAANLCCLSYKSIPNQRTSGNYVHCEFGLFKHENRTYRMVQATLQFICTGLSLTIMLAAMTYNVCIIFAIVSGKSLASL